MNDALTDCAMTCMRRKLRRLLIVFALFATLACGGPVVAASTPGQRAAAPQGNALPVGIAQGPDGNLWFTENAGIGRITPGGRMTLFPVPGIVQISPTAPMGGECLYCYGRIVQGSDGNLYFTQRHAIGRMTVTGKLTELPIRPDHGPPVNLIVGPDGNLWFEVAPPHYQQDGYLARMTLDGRTTWFRRKPSMLAGGLAVGPDQNLWLTLPDGLARMSITGQILARYPLPISAHTCPPQCEPFGIVAGPDGNMWFTLWGADAEIGRSTLAGKIAIFRLRSRDMGAPIALAAGHDGRVWFSKILDHLVGVVTTQGRIREFTVPGGVDNFPDIAPGNDQNMWFTEVCANSIGRITPTGQITNFHIPGTATRAGDWCLGF